MRKAIVAGITLLAFILLTLWVRSGGTQAWDDQFLRSIHPDTANGVESFWIKVNAFGGPFYVFPAVGVAVVALLWKRLYREGIFLAVAMGGSAVINLGLRDFFKRPRPVAWNSPVLDHSFIYGYPGGHATLVASVACCCILLTANTRYRWLVAALGAFYVLMIGFSSAFLQVHYATDLFGGWMLAVMCCLAAAKILESSSEGVPIESASDL